MDTELMSCVILDKQVGETPLECMNRFKKNNPDYADKKMTYAGRLDPMASGLLVVLVGDAVHQKEGLLGLPKTYEVTALLGIATDTYDILGIPTYVPHHEMITDDQCKDALKRYEGTFSQAYPPYSSKTIQGKQLHSLARSGLLEGVELPTHEVTLSEISGSTLEKVSMQELVHEVLGHIQHVTGDFRQEIIGDAWKKLLEHHPQQELRKISCTMTVSGGTYIRGIIDAWGKQLGSGACLIGLRRTRVGTWGILDIYQ